MADNSVFITGAASGAFTDAFSDLPPWASEKTALQIEKYLRKSLKVEEDILKSIKDCCKGAGTGKMKPEDAKKVNDELGKLGKNLSRGNEELAKQRKRDKDKEKDEKDALGRSKKKKTADEQMALVLTSIVSAGAKVKGVFVDYIDVYDQLYRSGINVMRGNESTTDGFEVLNQMVNTTGMRLQTLQQSIQKYSQSVNAISLTKFSKAVQGSTKALNEQGYYGENQLDLLGSILEVESNFIDVRKRSTQQIVSDSVKFGTQMTKLSQMVGQSREQLIENMKGEAKTAEIGLVRAKYGEEAAKNLLAVTAGLAPELRKAVIDMAAVDSPAAQSEMYKKLASAGMADVAEQVAAISKRALTGTVEDINSQISTLGNQLQDTGRMRQLSAIWDDQGKAAGEAISALINFGNTTVQASDVTSDNSKKTQESISRLRTEMESLSATTQKMFYPMVKQVDLVTEGLSRLNGALDKAVLSINGETRSWIGAGIIIAGFVAGVLLGTSVLNKAFTMLGAGASVLGRTLTGVGNGLLSVGSMILNAGKWVVGALSSLPGLLRGAFTGLVTMIGSAFTTVTGAIAAGGIAIRTAFMSILSGLGPILKTVGKLALVAGVGYAVDAGLGAMGVGGNEINDEQDKKNWKQFSLLEKVESGLGRSIESLGKIFFLDNLANEAASDRIKKETDYLRKKEEAKGTKIGEKPTPVEIVTPIKAPQSVSVPRTPGNTPIMTSEQKTEEEKQTVAPPIGSAPSAVVPPGISKPDRNADINNLLTYQGNLLEQILMSTNNLVSVNKDILRYARNSV